MALTASRLTVTVFYIILAYCDVIVLSQRFNSRYGSGPSQSTDEGPSVIRQSGNNDMSVRPGRTAPRSPGFGNTVHSDTTKYFHGLTYDEHKRASASELSGRYSSYAGPSAERPRYQVRPSGRPRYPVRPTTTTQNPQTTDVPYSYFRTTQKPLRELNWRDDRYQVSSRRPTVRAVNQVKSPFGQATIVTTGLRPQNICCQNETTNGTQLRNKFRYYNTFSKDRGYVPDRAIKYVTTTTMRPATDWSTSGDSRFKYTSSRYGIGSSDRVIGVDNDLDKEDFSMNWRTSTTERPTPSRWLPRTTTLRPGYHYHERVTETRWNSSLKSPILTDTISTMYSPSVPRSGFDGSYVKPWEKQDRKERYNYDVTTTTRRPPVSTRSSNKEEYDYYDELEDKEKKNALRYTSTRAYPTRPTTKRPSYPAPIQRTSEPSQGYNYTTEDDTWNKYLRRLSSTSTTARPRFVVSRPYELPPTKVNQGYDEDDDFRRWKASIEKTVDRLRKPSGRFRSTHSSFRMIQAQPPTLEGDEMVLPEYKVDGVEEEDWKFVHETNKEEGDKVATKFEGLSWSSRESGFGEEEVNTDFSEIKRPNRPTTSFPPMTATTERPLALWNEHIPRRRRPTRLPYVPKRPGTHINSPRYRHRFYTPRPEISVAEPTTALPEIVELAPSTTVSTTVTTPLPTTSSPPLTTSTTTPTPQSTTTSFPKIPRTWTDPPKSRYSHLSFDERLAKAREDALKPRKDWSVPTRGGGYKVEKEDDIEGSGFDIDGMIADAVPEVADVDLADELSVGEMEEEVRQMLMEEVDDDGTVFGELMDEHIIKVNNPKKEKTKKTKQNA